MVPEGWERKRLGAIATLQRGFDLPKKARQHGRYPVISSGGISGYHNEPKASAPGVVTGRYGSIGDVFFVNEDFWPLNTALWVKDFHGNDHKFVYYLLSRINFSKFSDKTGVPGINRNDIHAVKSLLPSVPEQRNIAKVLSTWDRAIETTEKLIENSEAQKKALMQSLLTGKKRFPSLVATNKTRETRYGDLPRDWSFVTIGDIATERTERAGENSDLPVLSCSKYDGFVDSLRYFKKKVYSDDTSNYKVVRRGDYGFPSNHIEEGSIGYQDICEAGIVSPIYSVFNTSDDVHDGYLYRLLKTEHYRQIFQASTNASVDRRGSLRWKEFSKIRVPLPSLEEQQKISETIDAADADLACLRNHLLRLNTEKRALMQQLLTGKRRVNVTGKTA